MNDAEGESLTVESAIYYGDMRALVDCQIRCAAMYNVNLHLAPHNPRGRTESTRTDSVKKGASRA